MKVYRFLMVALLGLTACQQAIEKPKGAAIIKKTLHREELCHTGIDAFSKTVYPHIRKDCLPCHDDGGLAGVPHSSSNMEKSYRRMVGYLNVGDIDHSFLVMQGGNLHCLEYEGGHCTTTVPEMRQLVQAWWAQGQKACQNLGKFISRPKAAPQEAKAQTVRFDLSHLTHSIGKSAVEVSVRREGDFYLIEKPRLLTPEAYAQLSGMSILLNGKPQISQNSWDLIQASLPPQSEKGALLSAFSLRIPVEMGASDEISLSLQKLEKRDTFSCKNTKDFQKNVMPMLAQRSCYRCHSGGPNHEVGEEAAKESLNMDLNPDLLCQALLIRGSGKNAIDSPLISLPLRGMLGHPRVVPLSSEVLPMWSDWIHSEGVH